jgi:ParB family chromosome partitioning protein
LTAYVICSNLIELEHTPYTLREEQMGKRKNQVTEPVETEAVEPVETEAVEPVETEAVEARGLTLENVALDLIEIGDNIRTEIDDLEGMAASIREFGVLEPVRVEPVNAFGVYRLCWGQRRVLAARLAGLETIPALVGPASAENVRPIEQLVENLQRRDLNPLEEARALRDALAAEPSLTQKALGDRIGRSQAFVANALRMLDLTPSVASLVEAGSLSGAHAKALASLTPERQATVAEQAVTGKWSAHELERAVKADNEQTARAEKRHAQVAEWAKSAVSGLEEQDAPKDAILYVSDTDMSAALAEAGWPGRTTDWPTSLPEDATECDCTAWSVRTPYSDAEQPVVRRTCVVGDHRDQYYARMRAENEARWSQEREEKDRARLEEQQAEAERRQSLANAILAALPDLHPALARTLLCGLLVNDMHGSQALLDRYPLAEDLEPDLWLVASEIPDEALAGELVSALVESIVEMDSVTTALTEAFESAEVESAEVAA